MCTIQRGMSHCLHRVYILQWTASFRWQQTWISQCTSYYGIQELCIIRWKMSNIIYGTNKATILLEKSRSLLKYQYNDWRNVLFDNMYLLFRLFSHNVELVNCIPYKVEWKLRGKIRKEVRPSATDTAARLFFQARQLPIGPGPQFIEAWRSHSDTNPNRWDSSGPVIGP